MYHRADPICYDRMIIVMAVSTENKHSNTCLTIKGEGGGRHFQIFTFGSEEIPNRTEKSANRSEEVSNLGPSECKSSVIL
jgi:hypothetical protein